MNELPNPDELDLCLLADRYPLRKRLQGLQRLMADQPAVAEGLARFRESFERSRAIVELRRATLPQPEFPPDLPISQKWQEIAGLIATNQVIVLCGETGSGKSTQLPKICLTLGRGIFGRIGHTQPRRIAARTLANRIAQELGCQPGTAVGYKVRFHDQVRPETHIKLLTDGMLLAEVQQDRFLNEYDTLIIDEAHERSLNIDFLLGYLRQLLPKRPDLKLIVTSATIDPERFSRHFNNAPILNVSGRTFPVEVRYRPPQTEEVEVEAQRPGKEPPKEKEAVSERDDAMQRAICDAVDELGRIDRGDILIFLSGEREIRETAETLRKHRLQLTEVLPLYARQSVAEQSRIFQPGGLRRIVLATNVAETSLTVPGIRYVIDTGFARISRYSHRSKVQRLPVERISKASADQRKGRCGRVAAGVCIRLYNEEEFNARRDFTEPEILRTNLAAVILQMKVLGVGEIEAFPFVEPPDPRQIKDGYRLLEELGAILERRLTNIGRKLARLPVDPRIGRMLLEAAHTDCLREVLVIAAALSVQDPRDRPLDKQQAADEAHRLFRHEGSDFLGFLKLWDHLEEQRRHLSKRKFQNYCRERFLSWNRVQEWHDIHQQLRLQMHEMGYKENPPVPAVPPEMAEAVPAQPPRKGRRPEAPRTDKSFGNEPRYHQIHQALLTGLLSHIGFRGGGKEYEYEGARNSRFYLFPGSGLFEHKPKWVMAAELVETTRLYARTAAAIQPEWVEAVAGHLLKRNYSEPHWEKGRGQVAAYERVTLFGLTLIPKRKVNYGPINPDEAREIFLRFALTEGDFETRAPFWRHNRDLIDYVHSLEEKSRRRDLLVDEEAIYGFYAARIPAGIYSTPQFEQWLRQASQKQPKLLHLRLEDLLQKEQVPPEQLYPDHLDVQGMQLPLVYRFDPQSGGDGVTLKVPRAVLNQVSEECCQWLVPGLLRERVIALLRGLPKSLRKSIVPVPDYADACLKRLQSPDRPPSDKPLTRALAEELKALTGVHIPEDAWDESQLPDYLRLNLQVLDEGGRILEEGRDLLALKKKHGGSGGTGYHRLPSQELEREGITRWDFGPLPETVELKRGGILLRGYPALVDQGDSLALRVLDAPHNAEAATRAGLRRLIQLTLPQELRYLRKNLPGLERMRLQYAKAAATPEGLDAPDKPDLEGELLALVVDLAFLEGQPPLRDGHAFERRIAERKPQLITQAQQAVKLTGEILDLYQQARQRLAAQQKPAWLASSQDIQQQIDRLVFQGFLRNTPPARLRDFPRYLKGVLLRLEKLPLNPGRDRQWMDELGGYYKQWQAKDLKARQDRKGDERLEELRWMFEELRISLFAQELKAAYPISVKRLERRWQALGL